MLTPHINRHYWITSIVLHVAILLVLIIEFESKATLPVFENTNQHDVISAVVLGDTAKSHVLPKQISTPKPVLPPPVDKPKPKPAPSLKKPDQKEAIALKKPDKKKLAEQKMLEALKKKNVFGKDLLADIKTENEKKKQKQLQTQFQKMLRDQTEQSLRQQLLNEEIKLQGTQSRQSQGEVNKYKALILQAISEHWVVPLQADKRLYCELMIRVAPGGLVLDVQITKTSGDPALDSSARAAVLKASPLPVPSDPNDFAAFRQFALKVKPENIMEST